jgi:hypothetical protein
MVLFLTISDLLNKKKDIKGFIPKVLTLKNVIISKDAIDFLRLRRRLRDPQIIIYRDICNLSYGYGRQFTFIQKLKVFDGKKPNKYFMKYDDSCGIPVWIEKGLLSHLENKPILITLKKGLLKGLKLETGYKILATQ